MRLAGMRYWTNTRLIEMSLDNYDTYGNVSLDKHETYRNVVRQLRYLRECVIRQTRDLTGKYSLVKKICLVFL
jgi:hypothetical protein